MRTLQVFVAVLSAVTICVCVHAQDGDRESLVGNVDTLRVPIRKVRLVNNNVLPEEVVARVVGDVVSQYEDGYLTRFR